MNQVNGVVDEVILVCSEQYASGRFWHGKECLLYLRIEIAGAGDGYNKDPDVEYRIGNYFDYRSFAVAQLPYIFLGNPATML